MQFENTQAIVLSRTNYGEADKIITSLTKNGNKLSIIAKGVRKPKSKLVAGTELFCVSDICYVPSRGAMATLTSARIIRQHTTFLSDLERVSLGYEIIKTINKHTQDVGNDAYYKVLTETLVALDDNTVSTSVVGLWTWTRLLVASGRQLQLQHQTDGNSYSESYNYAFDIENGGFIVSNAGTYTPVHIKLLRLAQSQTPAVLMRVQGVTQYAHDLVPGIKQFVETT